MRDGLDLVDLQNPKVRRPPVRLEQRIMIGTEMSRCAPTVNSRASSAMMEKSACVSVSRT